MSSTVTSTEKCEIYIEESRTYTRDQVYLALNCGEEFVVNLEEFFGLLPLGSKSFVYRGRSILDSLERHATGDVVLVERRPKTVKELRALKRLRKEYETSQ